MHDEEVTEIRYLSCVCTLYLAELLTIHCMCTGHLSNGKMREYGYLL